MEGLLEDAGDGSMQCTEHPFKNNTPAGGICAFCLQEKLGKLVSSSFPMAVFPSSSSSSPSFRSDIGGTTTSTTATTTVSTAVAPPPLGSNTQISTSNTTTNCHHHGYYANRSRLLYLLTQKKKKKDLDSIVDGYDHRSKNLVFKRSKSTATGGRRGGGGGGLHYVDADNDGGDNSINSPHKRGFWSFIHSQKHTRSSSSTMKTLSDISSNSLCAPTVNSFPQAQMGQRSQQQNESPRESSFDRKVSRSRSVGCGSRSFSGDFFERISTGLGDCTLRLVESQRNGGQDCIKERVRCGGLFSGFMITSSSSSSSSSSYWVASKETSGGNVTGKVTSAAKSWGWALASPMRAFSKPSSSSLSKREDSNKNQTPNLSAIPSLLSVRS